MTDHAVQSAAGTIGNWRARRAANGKAPNDDELRKEIATRWPALTGDQIESVVDACQKPRDER